MKKDDSCCAPQRTKKTLITDRSTGKISSPNTEKVALGGGPFRLGSNYEFAYPQDGEEFTTEVTLSPFLIDKHSVTNQKFMTFVEDTGYVTEAEEVGLSCLADYCPMTSKILEEFKELLGGGRSLELLGNRPKGCTQQ